MGSLAELLGSLADDVVKRGRQFEHICKWYLENDPLYRRELKQVWLWNEWSGRWGAEAGIDLVAEAHDGGLWAIQAKAYDPRYAIKKSDVDKFLSESSRAQFSFRLLIATTNRIGSTARRTLEAQEKPGHVLLLADLEGAGLEWPSSPNKLIGRPPKAKKPRPHQRSAIRAVTKGFETTDRGQLLMACGTGKTLTALWIDQALDSERTLVLLPSLTLLSQALREWVTNGEEFEFLPVCSDATVRGDDEFVSSTIDLGFPVTTNPKEIAAFLRKRGRRVIFSTYQSSPQIAEAMKGRAPAFDLVIADEAHRCAGRVSGGFATVLDERAIRTKRRLFMTATPRYFTGRLKKEAAALDLEVASMDDPIRFGPVLHRLTFATAIDEDLLSDYQVAVVVVDDETIRGYAEAGTFVMLDGSRVLDARSLGAAVGLAKAMRRYDLHRLVSFHSRVTWAREFSAAMPEVIAWMPRQERPKGQLWSRHISGAMSSGQRDILLAGLRNLDGVERGLLSNARCLSEGVDVPTLDGVAFVDPRRSEVDVVQAVGRAIRKSPDKKLGTIVLPVFMGEQDDPFVELDGSAFKPVWDVLQALRAHDQDLAEELDELRWARGARPTSTGRRPGKIKLILPVGVDAGFAQAFDTRLVDHTTTNWEFAHGVLTRFANRERHSTPPAKYVEDGFPLGSWVSVQRQFRKAGKLSANRAARLEALPGWEWDVMAAALEEGFSRLGRYFDREGNSWVPDDHDEDGFPLGQWCGKWRNEHLHGRLDAERVARFEAFPDWEWNRRDAVWDERFAYLQRYVEREGDALVPQAHFEDGYELGKWVAQQRAFRGRGYLSARKVERLQELPGWAWNANEARWEQGFALLQDFIAKDGHPRVPPRHMVDGFRLGRWVAHQRAFMQRDELSQERTLRLEALPGWIWKSERASLDWFTEEMETFSQREGHGAVPTSHVTDEGFRLGDWLTIARKEHKRGGLAPDLERRLEALPHWSWDPYGDSWEEGYSHLADFVRREGHARVPKSYLEGDGFHLGSWVSNQRTRLRGGRLSKDRAARLEGLSGWE